MELHTRWTKIFKDMWDHRERSILVILSIAVGVATFGMINNTARIIERDLFDQYLLGHPAHAQLYISPFDEDLAEAVEDMREVEAVQPRRLQNARISSGDEWFAASLNTVPDFEDVSVNAWRLEAGRIAPGQREIVLERQSAIGLGLTVGDTVTVEMPDETRYALTVTGIVHDMGLFPYTLSNEITAYVSMDTLQWMGVGAYYNRLDLRVASEDLSTQTVNEIALAIRDRTIQPSGYYVGRVIAGSGYGSKPGEYWAQAPIDGFLLVLQIMSVLAILLSSGLVVNTITAILTQQIKQIGIMRSVGAVRPQIVVMYIANVLIYSSLALLVAVPLGLVGTWALCDFAGDFMNFDIVRVDLSPGLVVAQAGLGLMMPALVALYPIVAGTGISVYDAIYQHGLSSEGKRGPLDRLLVRLSAFSPPVLLSLRNTFRKKARLIFTLSTLTLAGSMFMAVFSTRASLTQQIDEIVRYVEYDASISVSGVTRYAAEREALRVPGVTVAEVWLSSSGVIMNTDGSEGEEVELVGLPANSATLDPQMYGGRWLREGDQLQVVLNDDLLETQPDLRVGDQIELKIAGTIRTVEVVGVTSKHLSGGRIYFAYETLSRLTGRHNQADSVRVRASADVLGSAREQKALADALEEHFIDAGLTTARARTQADAFAMFTDAFDIILIVLVVMASLLALVGGLSLTGTMGINVLERTREIGVLRAVGASNWAIRQVVVVEGIVVGFLSWVISAILSAPLGMALAAAVVAAVLQADLSFRYSFAGLLMWLVIITLIGIGASLAPAFSAERLTVREVLDYE